MKVKELKQMPQNLEVEVTMHDNAEYESAGNVCSVNHFIKSEFYDNVMSTESQMVDECVIIGC